MWKKKEWDDLTQKFLLYTRQVITLTFLNYMRRRLEMNSNFLVITTALKTCESHNGLTLFQSFARSKSFLTEKCGFGAKSRSWLHRSTARVNIHSWPPLTSFNLISFDLWAVFHVSAAPHSTQVLARHQGLSFEHENRNVKRSTLHFDRNIPHKIVNRQRERSTLVWTRLEVILIAIKMR